MPWVAINGSGIAFSFFPDETGPSPPSMGPDSIVTVDVPSHVSNSYGGWAIETFSPRRLRVSVIDFAFSAGAPALSPGQFAFYSADTGWNYTPNELSYPAYLTGFSPSEVAVPEGDGTMNFQFSPPIPPGGGGYEFDGTFVVEIWVDDGPGPDPGGGCFWDGLVMATEECTAGGSFVPEFASMAGATAGGAAIYANNEFWTCDPGLGALSYIGMTTIVGLAVLPFGVSDYVCGQAIDFNEADLLAVDPPLSVTYGDPESYFSLAALQAQIPSIGAGDVIVAALSIYTGSEYVIRTGILGVTAGEWFSEFGHRTPTSSPDMALRREHFCDMGTYGSAAAGGTDLILTHIAARGGPTADDGWECGDGNESEPTFIELGEPLYFSRSVDGSDNVMWTMPWGVLAPYLPDYYGFVSLRCEVNNESPFIIEGVAFASPGF